MLEPLNRTSAIGVAQRIKIVLLLQDLEYGGTQRYALHMMKNLDRGLFSPQLWVLRGGQDMVPAAHAQGTEPCWLSHSRIVGARALMNLAFRLATQRLDILYTLTVVPNIWGRVFGTIAKVPVIVSSMRDLNPKQYESWMWPLSTRIICNSQVLRDLTVRRFRVDPKRIVVVPNAVDPTFFSPDRCEKAERPTILYVGRLAREKDLITLLEAFKLVLQRLPGTRLNVLGNGSRRGKLAAFVRQHSLESSVRLLGGLPDPRPLYREAWVFAMSSVREAAPNALLEAMAMGLPTVATKVGGIPEIIVDGDTGVLVDPGRADNLADALVELLSNERQRRRMGRKGREKVIAYHRLDLMVGETQKVLLEAFNEAAVQKKDRRLG